MENIVIQKDLVLVWCRTLFSNVGCWVYPYFYQGVPVNVLTIGKSKNISLRIQTILNWVCSFFACFCKNKFDQQVLLQSFFNILAYFIFYNGNTIGYDVLITFFINSIFFNMYGFDAALRLSLKLRYFSPTVFSLVLVLPLCKVICRWPFYFSSLLKYN